MRVAVLALFVVLLASFAVAMTPVEIKRDYGNSVVTIATYSSAEDALGLGSGFIVDSLGVIVTCYHVIDGAYPAVVRLLNGASFQDISVLGCDSASDVAVIKVKGRNLPTVKLVSSADIEVGERVVAIGNPKGLENTVSDGLLSGIRDMDGKRLLQISAPISPGSSGGPVFNSAGLVVGIASASLKEGQNLNFCVPIQYARPLLSCTSSVTLEEFSRGIRPGEATASHQTPGGPRREFLRALMPMLRSFWELTQYMRHDKYRRLETEQGFVMLLALAREQADNALRTCLEIRAPDAELQRILRRYAELAQRRFDAWDLMLRAYPNDMVSQAAGLAKEQGVTEETRSDEGYQTLTRDLACQYVLDAGTSMESLGAKLPAVFDSLPAVIAIGARFTIRDLYPRSRAATAMNTAQQRVLGFLYYIDTPGIVVDSVVAGSQAEKAGLCRDDVLTGVNDTLRIGNSWDWGMFKGAQPVGESFVLNIVRAERSLRLHAALAMQSSAPGTE